MNPKQGYWVITGLFFIIFIAQGGNILASIIGAPIIGAIIWLLILNFLRIMRNVTGRER